MAVTLVHGTSFCVCDDDGEFGGALAEGTFYQDTRILSGWNLRIDGKPVEPITVQIPEPFQARFVGRAHSSEEGKAHCWYAGSATSAVVCARTSSCATTAAPRSPAVSFRSRPTSPTSSRSKPAVSATRATTPSRSPAASLLARYLDSTSRGVRITGVTLDGKHAKYSRDRVSFRVVVPPGEEWYASVTALPLIDGTPITPLFPRERPVELSGPAILTRRWREESPVLSYSENRTLATTLQRSRETGALRMFDLEHPDDVGIAAGAPWFMALFGRDSLIASLMSLAVDPTLALGTVQTLARHQGTTVEPNSEEEPGRILHEVRFGADVSLALGGSHIYYGSIDATPLFVMLLGELSRWGIKDWPRRCSDTPTSARWMDRPLR